MIEERARACDGMFDLDHPLAVAVVEVAGLEGAVLAEGG